MRAEQEFVYADFSGGINLNAAPYLVADNQARDALNVHSNSNSQLRKRLGWTTLASLAASPGSLTAAPHTAAAAEVSGGDYIIFVGPYAGGDKFVASTTSGTLTDLNGTTTPTGSTRWHIAQGSLTSGSKGPIFAMNGADTPQYWDGNTSNNFANWTADSGTLPTTGKFLIYHANRLWCAAGSAAPSRLRYSGLSGSSVDTGAWDTDDFVDFHPSDGQAITGIGTLGPNVLVFKERKAFKVYDTVTGANNEIVDGIGCAAHRSIVETKAGTFFLDETGVYLTDGETVTLVSDAITPLIEDAAVLSTFPNAAAVYANNSYWLSLAISGSTHNRTLEYDLNTEAWWIHDCASNAFATISTSTGDQVYSANPATTNGQRAFVPDTFQDSGSNYAGTSFWTGPHLVWGQPHKRKRVREVRMDGTGTWVLGTSTDYQETFTNDSGEVWVTTDTNAPTYYWGSSTWGGATWYVPPTNTVTTKRFYTPGIGSAVTFKIVNDDATDFALFSYMTAIGYRKD